MQKVTFVFSLAALICGISAIRQTQESIDTAAENERFIGLRNQSAGTITQASEWDGVFRGKIGLDIGGVLNQHRNDFARQHGTSLKWWETSLSEAPNAMKSLRRILELFGPPNVYIVSYLPEHYRDMSDEWLYDVMNITATGLLKENIYYTDYKSGLDGKGQLAARLHLTHFVDDIWECIDSVLNDIDYTVGNAFEDIKAQNGVVIHFTLSGLGNGLAECPRCLLKRFGPYYTRAANWKEALSLLEANLQVEQTFEPAEERERGCDLCKY